MLVRAAATWMNSQRLLSLEEQYHSDECCGCAMTGDWTQWRPVVSRVRGDRKNGVVVGGGGGRAWERTCALSHWRQHKAERPCWRWGLSWDDILPFKLLLKSRKLFSSIIKTRYSEGALKNDNNIDLFFPLTTVKRKNVKAKGERGIPSLCNAKRYVDHSKKYDCLLRIRIIVRYM